MEVVLARPEAPTLIVVVVIVVAAVAAVVMVLMLIPGPYWPPQFQLQRHAVALGC